MCIPAARGMIQSNGSLPHRPTKGLSERLRSLFAPSPFGNLRAKTIRFLKISNSVCSSISRHLNNANLHEKTLFIRLLNNHLILIGKVKGTQFPCGAWGKAPTFPTYLAPSEDIYENRFNRFDCLRKKHRQPASQTEGLSNRRCGRDFARIDGGGRRGSGASIPPSPGCRWS